MECLPREEKLTEEGAKCIELMLRQLLNELVEVGNRIWEKSIVHKTLQSKRYFDLITIIRDLMDLVDLGTH
jgi:hypothetical protein